MAGTRTTPPPMPRRPTSTPAPSPRRRMMNVIVMGRLCAYRLDDSNQISAVFYLPPSGLPAATGVDERQRQEMYGFFCLHGTCYIYLSLSRRSRGLLAVVRPIAGEYPQKRETPRPDPAGGRKKKRGEPDPCQLKRK